MSKTCPFCRTEIPSQATICPNCTRDTRDLESVFGPPPSLEQRLRSMHASASADVSFGIVKIVVVSVFALLVGIPLLPIILIGGLLIGFALLVMHIAKSPSSGGRHDG